MKNGKAITGLIVISMLMSLWGGADSYGLVPGTVKPVIKKRVTKVTKVIKKTPTKKVTKKITTTKPKKPTSAVKNAQNILSIKNTEQSITTIAAAYSLEGTSNIKEPLYINDILVGNRDVDGSFNLPVILSFGDNSFVLRQGDKTLNLNVNRQSIVNYRSPIKLSSPLSGPSDAAAQIPQYGIFPEYSVFKKAGSYVTLLCLAPADSQVSAIVEGKEIPLTREWVSDVVKNGSYLVKYSAKMSLPSFTGSEPSKNLGNVSYRIKFKNGEVTVKSKGSINVLADNARVLAEMVNTAQAFEYISFYSKNGYYEKGMKDFVYKSDYEPGSGSEKLQLGTGKWVNRTDVELSASTSYKPEVLSTAYTVGERHDYIEFGMKSRSITSAKYEPGINGKGGIFTYKIESAGSSPEIKLPAESIFSSVGGICENGSTIYTFALKDDRRIDGIYTESTSKGIRLQLKRHDDVKITETNKNTLLAGKIVVIDPGHGGKDCGAEGFGRLRPHETDIIMPVSLKLKEKLEKAGAQVIMVRTDDIKVPPLEQRVNFISISRPDAFISVHANSATSNAKGFEILYRDHISLDYSKVVGAEFIAQTGRVDRGVKLRGELFVIQPEYAPTALVELGFVSNKEEQSWMGSEAGMEQMSKALADGIAKYFIY